MTPNLMRIEAALNAYPWTAGSFATTSGGSTRYCAVGMLLRYAGVSAEHIDLACNRGAVAFWEYYRALLQRDYGISQPEQIHAIMVANDGADTHEDALERVRFVLTRVPLRSADVLALIPLPATFASAEERCEEEHGPLMATLP